MLPLAELQRIKQWHTSHRHDHPLEYQLWDLVVTVWLMGWIGWLPAYAFDAFWAYPLCLMGVMTPGLYVQWRARADANGRLRCEWMDRLG